MINFIIGLLWLLVMMFVFYCTGHLFLKSTHSGPCLILRGYIIYSFGIAVIGIIIQSFNVPWNVFRNLSLTWMVLVLVLSLLAWKKSEDYNHKKINFRKNVSNFISDYGFLIAILLAIIILSVSNYPAFWSGNRADDGFYLSKIAIYPYVSDPYNYDMATGLYTGKVLNQYSINTHELEYSVYFSLLNIPIGLFTRVFMAALNYILFACCIYSLSETVLKFLNRESKYKKVIQFVPGVILLFTTNFVFLANNGVLNLQDSWQTTTAMYFGSSVVRTCGFFLLLLPLMEKFDLNIKTVIEVFMVSVVLISKSTIALPIILVSALSYICVWLLFRSNIPNTLVLFVVIILTCIGLVLPTIINLENYGFESWQALRGTVTILSKANYKSFIVWLTIAFLLPSVLFKKIRITKLTVLTLVLSAFIFIPGLNGWFLLSSLYGFVVGRTITAFAYFAICLSLSYGLGWLTFVGINKFIVYSINVALSLIMVLVNATAFTEYGGDGLSVQGQEQSPMTFQKAWTVIMNNPDFIPVSSEQIAASLNRLANKNGHLAVLTETNYQTDGVADFKYILLRSLSPNVIFPTANLRFASTSDPIYGTYDASTQKVFEDFLEENSTETLIALSDVLEKYQINAVLLRNGDSYNQNMESIGFSLYDVIPGQDGNESYYIFSKNTN